MREHGILLALVEAMDLVDEEDRPASGAQPFACALDDLAEIGNAGTRGAHSLECCPARAGDEHGQRRLAAPRRPPENE